jgi:hypothetical protein
MNNKFQKVLTIALASSTIFYPVQAAADPISIGNLVITGLISVGAPSAVLLSPALVGGLVTAAASIGLSILTQKGAGSIDPGQAKEEIIAEETSELRGIGTVRVSGALNYGNNNHPNLYRHLLHLKGPIDTIIGTYVNEREVIKDSFNRVLSPPWTDFNSDGSVNTTYLNLSSKIGDGTEVSYTELTNAFPDVWTSNHRVRGIFQTLVTVNSPGVSSSKYLKMFGARQYPKLEYVVRSSLIYDPTKDTTRTGGSGSHRIDDESTWEWSDNGILGALYIFMQYPDFSESMIDWESQIAQVQAANVLVTTKTGTEKRSRISGVWPSQSNRGDTLKQVMDSVGCELVSSNAGKYYFKLIDDNPISQVSIQEKDIYDLEWQAGPKAIERPNTCEIKYYSPERNYEMTEIDMTGISWATIDDEVDRWGEKILTIELPFCPSASQAQRIARRIFEWSRADAGTVITNMSGMAAFGCNYGTLDIVGDNEVCKITSPRCNDQNGETDIAFISLPFLAAWNPVTDEADAPNPYAEQVDDTELTTPDAPTDVFSVTYLDNAKELRVQFNGVTGATGYLGMYAGFDANGLPSSYSPMLNHAGINMVYLGADLVGANIITRVQAISSDSSSNISDTLTIAAVPENSNAPVNVSNPGFSQSFNGSGSNPESVLNASFDGLSNNIVYLKVEAVYNTSLKDVIYDGKRAPTAFSGSVIVQENRTWTSIEITQTVHGGQTLLETFIL